MFIIKKKNFNIYERLTEADQALSEANIDYKIMNNGSHYILDTSPKIHYWPTSGKWYIPSIGHRCTEPERYLPGLLTYLNIPFQLRD